ncbi:MAG: GNAT family N-acetyltransferase [Acidovorax sp.]
MAESAIIARILASPLEVDASAWNALLAQQSHPTPFMRHEYLAALHESQSAVPHTGWTPRFMTLWEGDMLVAACPLYIKSHSYGEYVFDWAWASAYEQHGLPYYPKAVVAVPFTPVPGARLLARDDTTRQWLVQALRQWCEDEGLSSLHVLFASDADVLTGARQGLMLRHTVQFHWENASYQDFDDFLARLTQEKRKKIRQERRRVAEAGVTFRWALGADITPSDWDFFYRCYERTYLEHGNPPYLTRAFFQQMAERMPEHWLLFIAEREGRPIASSLIAIDAAPFSASDPSRSQKPPRTAYGRYWGALEPVDCLHFEACYYQPLAWCIAHGVQRFEGGAQGEHKMARALLPVQATSLHWLAHPAFADAVERFLAREGAGVQEYLDHLQARSPFRTA